MKSTGGGLEAVGYQKMLALKGFGKRWSLRKLGEAKCGDGRTN